MSEAGRLGEGGDSEIVMSMQADAGIAGASRRDRSSSGEPVAVDGRRGEVLIRGGVREVDRDR